MLDPHGRPITNLRISVTQRCNLNCFYCHKEGQFSCSEVSGGEMSPEEIGLLVETASSLGITKLKLTGGEPLLRKDILEIISRSSRFMKDISLTTNGILLNDFADELSSAGLNRINISLDTLKPETYMELTGKNGLSSVLNGIDAVKGNGISPIKLNMVLMKGINEDEIPSMAKFSRDIGGILQIIELETTRECIDSEIYCKYHSDLMPVERWLDENALAVKERRMHRRRKYLVPIDTMTNGGNGGDGSTAEIELVRPMHNSEFCSNCTRLRVTAEGRLKPCLLKDEDLVNILTPIRTGAGQDELIEIFKRAVSLREPYWQ